MFQFDPVETEELQQKDVNALLGKAEGAYIPTPEECEPVLPEGVHSGRTDGYAPLEGFDSPAMVLAVFDAAVNTQRITVHPWQLDLLNTFADPGWKPTDKHPLKYCLCAANGSGKDAFTITPIVIWFALTKVRGRVIITSASAAQLEAQTENYIRSMAEAVNKMLGKNVFRIKHRYIRCNMTGAEIRLFATDEPGKAEGYHPIEAGAEMMIVVNEGKSIPEDIFQALTRCTGFNYWLETSSPGEPKGHFYNAFTTWKHKKKVTAFECPHLGEEHIEETRRNYGESSAFYRSMILAEFTTLDGQVVIPLEMWNKLLNVDKVSELDLPGEFKERIGIDFACGGDGDSTYLVRCRNNKVIDVYRVKSSDIDEQVAEMDRKLSEWNAKNARITMDDKGVGKGPLKFLERRGWPIVRIRADSRALNNKEFANRGAEIWFNVRRFFEELKLDFGPIIKHPDFDALRDQITRRHFVFRHGRTGLLPKKEEKKQGIPSPDIADALCFALSDLSPGAVFDSPEIKEPDKEKHIVGDNADLLFWHQQRRISGDQAIGELVKYDPEEETETYSYGSLDSIMSRRKKLPYDPANRNPDI